MEVVRQKRSTEWLLCQAKSSEGICKGSYVVFQDVTRDVGVVDARVFIGFEMDESLLRDVLMDCGFCPHTYVRTV